MITRCAQPRSIAGAAGGRRLAVPPGTGTRPTSDRAREGLFSSWESELGGANGWRGARVLDLYAGSGAVGLEALSRGAAHVLLVESEQRAVRTLRQNIRTLGLPGAEARAGKVTRVVADELPGAPYDVVFLDPPYDPCDDPWCHAVIRFLRQSDDSLCVPPCDLAIVSLVVCAVYSPCHSHFLYDSSGISWSTSSCSW